MNQVELDERVMAKITSDNGDISKEDFIKIAQDYKLLDFGNAMGGENSKQTSSKKPARAPVQRSSRTTQRASKVGEMELVCLRKQ